MGFARVALAGPVAALARPDRSPRATASTAALAASPMAQLNASRRLGAALVVSLLIHAIAVLALGSLPGLRHLPMHDAGVLEVMLPSLPATQDEQRVAGGHPLASDGRVAHADRHVGKPQSKQEQPTGATLPSPERPIAAGLPTPGHYYSARELQEVPHPVNDVLLRYPPNAYARGIAGEVTIRLLIDEAGAVDRASVVKAEPAGIFETAALDAARQLRFSPALRQGQPVKSEKTIAITFDPTTQPLR